MPLFTFSCLMQGYRSRIAFEPISKVNRYFTAPSCWFFLAKDMAIGPLRLKRKHSFSSVGMRLKKKEARWKIYCQHWLKLNAKSLIFVFFHLVFTLNLVYNQNLVFTLNLVYIQNLVFILKVFKLNSAFMFITKIYFSAAFILRPLNENLSLNHVSLIFKKFLFCIFKKLFYYAGKKCFENIFFNLTLTKSDRNCNYPIAFIQIIIFQVSFTEIIFQFLKLRNVQNVIYQRD